MRSSTSSRPPTVERPTSRDARVRLARAQQASLSDLDAAEVLHNSLSEGDYGAPRALRRAMPRSSVLDPEYHLGDSMSDGFYELPATLRAASFRPRRRQVRRRQHIL